MKTTFIISRVLATLAITAIPAAYIAICIALYVNVGWWAVALLICLSFFLPILFFQFRNWKKYRETAEVIDKMKKDKPKQE